MAEILANDILKIFLSDLELKEKYKITNEKIEQVTMTSKEDDLMIILIRELITRQSEDISSTNASSKLNNMLDNRL